MDTQTEGASLSILDNELSQMQGKISCGALESLGRKYSFVLGENSVMGLAVLVGFIAGVEYYAERQEIILRLSNAGPIEPHSFYLLNICSEGGTWKAEFYNETWDEKNKFHYVAGELTIHPNP